MLKYLKQLIGFYQPFNQFSKMHVYWEQVVFYEYVPVKYSIYIMSVSFGDFIEKFRNIGGHMLLLISISKNNYLI